jgi:hypothetical protein
MDIMALLDLHQNKTTCHYHFLLAIYSSTNLPRVSSVSATFSVAPLHKRQCTHRLQSALQYRNFSDVIDSKSASAGRSLTVSRGILRLAGLWSTVTIGTSIRDTNTKTWKLARYPIVKNPAFLELVNRSYSDMFRGRWSDFRVPIVAKILLT